MIVQPRMHVQGSRKGSIGAIAAERRTRHHNVTKTALNASDAHTPACRRAWLLTALGWPPVPDRPARGEASFR